MTPQDTREISLAAMWQLARPASLSVTVVACLLGCASAVGCGIALDVVGALAALLLACGFHMAANILQTCQVARPGAPAGAHSDPFGAKSGIDLIHQGTMTLTERARRVGRCWVW